MNRRTILVALLAIGVSCPPAFASLIAYEGFDYDNTTTTLSGRNGGVGWDNAWANNTGANLNTFLTIDDVSIPSPPNPLAPTGDRIAKTSNPNGGFATTSRTFNGVFNTANDTGLNMGANGTLYLSYAWVKDQDGGTGGDNIEIGLHDVALASTGNRFVRAGSTSGDAHFLVGGTSAAVAAGDIYDPIAFGTTYFTVIKVTASATGTDMVQASNFTLANPVPLTEPGAWQKTATIAAADTVNINGFSLQFGASARGQFDEIRIGTTWSEVTFVPEPSSMALFLLATVAGLRGRSRV